MKMRWMWLLLVLVVPFGRAGAAPAAVQTRRIVVFTPATPRAQRLNTLRQMGVSVVRELDLINAVVINVPSGESLLSVDQALGALPMVVRVENDVRRKWLLDEETYAPLPSDREILERLAHITADDVPPSILDIAKKPGAGEGGKKGPVTPWGIKRVNAPAAWDTTKGDGVRVAIVDTGIDFNHPDLRGNIAAGFNALVTTATAQDDNGHGTHVSGTVAGIGIEGGVLGVAPKAKLYAVKVLDADGSGYISDIIAGIQWAVGQHVQVLNMSLGGGGDDQSFHDAIINSVKAGVTVVCAAGNSGPSNDGTSTVAYPAKYPEAIAVAALQQKTKSAPETIADFSSRGPEVAFIAPGAHVYSSYLGGGYQYDDGTSMASPHVTGLAALAVAAGASDPAAVRAALTAASKRVDGLAATDEGAGVPNAAKIVGAAEAESGGAR